MTSRAMVTTWIVAILLAIAAALGLDRISGPAWLVRSTMDGADIAVIGTSLLVHGIPARQVSGGLLGDGRKHRRFAYDDMQEDEAVSILHEALASGASTILLEINPFAFDFAFRVRMNAEEDRHGSAPRILKHFSYRLQSGLEHLIGIGEFESGEPKDLTPAKNTADANVKSIFYPFQLHSPRSIEALLAAVNEARDRRALIILVAPPRARIAETWMGLNAEQALDRHLSTLAERLSLPLFHPGPGWPDELFVDNAHLNERGRARFCGELAAWYGRFR